MSVDSSWSGDRLGSVSRARGRKIRTADCRKCVIMAGLLEARMPVAGIKAICDGMWLNRTRRKQILYAEGNGATHLYAVRSGKVKLLKGDAFGRNRVTAVLRSGDMFGFEAIFEEAYDCGAEALTDGEVCLISADQLRRMVTDVPRMMEAFARYLHQQLARARRRQVAVTATGAAAKLASYLLWNLETAEEEGEETLARDLTLQDLGGILGVSAETACRVLSDLKSNGVVESRAGGVVVRDLVGLRRIARA